ncbi:plasmid mobilization relaxosome protein MobC [Microvirga sp. STS02]|uniref:plasmid mobilization protein n=1 Tax=Hymenobacter negativus TaxID=2795026 RepID=UPI0018DE668E|nr:MULTISPECIES: plasmid mobilization relaxosome protein MobC [Bacteria]MBH8571362.1 plasmid mobilization relaxosome protein MobC [Hymenobacter negativus]MBR7211100.1 plasmid mobilization relaxosome protein MobC [Microvirga sp. STS02]
MEPDKQAEINVDAARTLRIDVRLSPDEKKDLQEKAKAAGYKKVSTYLRDVGRGVEVKENIPPELRRQLVGIGTNLNQIARLAQAGKSFSSHEAQLVQALAIIRGYLV